jgi:hypothetical protein
MESQKRLLAVIKAQRLSDDASFHQTNVLSAQSLAQDKGASRNDLPVGVGKQFIDLGAVIGSIWRFEP